MDRHDAREIRRPMPAWDDIRLFLACYRAGSATRAARTLDTTVSTVSRRLDRLEAELGVVLFLRGNDGLVPTDAAERMIEPAMEAERRLAETFGSATEQSEEPEGVVRLAATTDLANFVLLPLMGRLLTRHPRLRVHMVLGTELSDLGRREADLAVRVGVSGSEGDLVVRHLRDEPIGFFASEAYLRRFPASLPMEEHRWITMGEASANAGIDRWLRERLPGVAPAFCTDDFTSLRLAAGAGVGVTILPLMYGAITPNLRQVPWDLTAPPTPMYVVAHRATRRSAAVRAVWDFVSEVLVPVPGRDDVAVVRAALTEHYGITGWPSSTTAANHSAENERPVRRE